MITVYLYDGTPIDVWSDYDIPENSTLIPPTDGLYQLIAQPGSYLQAFLYRNFEF